MNNKISKYLLIRPQSQHLTSRLRYQHGVLELCVRVIPDDHCEVVLPLFVVADGIKCEDGFDCEDVAGLHVVGVAGLVWNYKGGYSWGGCRVGGAAASRCHDR